jgi:phosphofructokinase-like protein
MKKKKVKRLGVLTGGGDCPGLNAAIRSVTRTANHYGIEVYGIERGFQGFYTDNIRKLDMKEVSGILTRGGTILKSSRFNPFKKDEWLAAYQKRFKQYKLDGLVVIGGDGSLGVALDSWKKLNIPTIGIPKTIDNDVFGTDFTIGFHTALDTAVDAIDKLHTTAESHDFVMIVELMGRHCGMLAAYAGLAGGADFILVPEKPVTINEIVHSIRERHSHGKNFSIIVAAEDAKVLDDSGKTLAETPTIVDDYGKIKMGGVSYKIKNLLDQRLGFETRCVVLGHVQRGGVPSSIDRLLATQMGYKAVEMAMAGRWGKLIAYDQGEVVAKPLDIVRKGLKRMPPRIYTVANTFFG